MSQDLFGNRVTVHSASALSAVDDFIGGFLAYQPRVLKVLELAPEHPDEVLLNTLAAVVCLFAESPEGPALAAPWLEAARRAAARHGAEEREHQWLQMVQHWAAGELEQSVALGEATLTRHPRDLALFKLLQYHCFNRGDCAGMLRLARQCLPVASEVPQVHGMLAFALEQCHLLPQAEHAARDALAMTRHEPWAQHALAHVMLTQGRISEGRAMLESYRDTWQGLTSFMETHNEWHLALFELSEGDNAAILQRYDDVIWARDRSYSQDQVGAVSLLARLELAGGEVGPRWQELAPYLQARRRDATHPFLTVQYYYGLLRAAATASAESDAAAGAAAASRNAALELLKAAMERAAAESALPRYRRVWEAAALPLMLGMQAHASGNPEGALEHWTPVQGQLLGLGGSHAQRDLFAQLYLAALMQAGEWNLAQQLLEMRRANEPEGVPLNRQLAATYAALGLPREAAVARAQSAGRR